MAQVRPRIAVVGGGPGGLFASYIINKRMPQARVTVLEASDRTGGKIYTDKFSDGTPFEAGVAELYQYLGPGGGDPLRLLIEKDLGLGVVNIAGGAVVLRDKILRDLDDVEAVHGRMTREHIEAFYRKASKLMPLERFANRWQPDNAHPWADKTFRECIESELSEGSRIDNVARDYIEAAVHSDLATESHTCNGLNGIKNVLMDNNEYLQVYHVVGGIERVPEALLKKIRGKVLTNTRVTGIKKENSRYRVSVLRVGGRELREKSKVFDAVVVAVPNHWLRMIHWEGKMEQAIHEIVAHYDLPAHYLRVSVLFDDKWWDDLGMSGEFWMMDMLNGCCCYDESTRWRRKGDGGHVLSFLVAGGDALLMCSSNQDDECIIDYVLQSLPTFMRQQAEQHFIDGQVDRYIGSINAQPGGWPTEDLRGEHTPEPVDHPGIFLVGDYFFDSTLNAALMSANVAVEEMLKYFGVVSAKVTEAIEQLEARGEGL
jgi:protoporphyrinogen oxidase